MLFNLKLYHSVPSAGATTNYYTKLSQRNYHDSAARGPIDFQTLADPYDSLVDRESYQLRRFGIVESHFTPLFLKCCSKAPNVMCSVCKMRLGRPAQM